MCNLTQNATGHNALTVLLFPPWNAQGWSQAALRSTKGREPTHWPQSWWVPLDVSLVLTHLVCLAQACSNRLSPWKERKRAFPEFLNFLQSCFSLHDLHSKGGTAELAKSYIDDTKYYNIFAKWLLHLSLSLHLSLGSIRQQHKREKTWGRCSNKSLDFKGVCRRLKSRPVEGSVFSCRCTARKIWELETVFLKLLVSHHATFFPFFFALQESR